MKIGGVHTKSINNNDEYGGANVNSLMRSTEAFKNNNQYSHDRKTNNEDPTKSNFISNNNGPKDTDYN